MTAARDWWSVAGAPLWVAIIGILLAVGAIVLARGLMNARWYWVVLRARRRDRR